MSNAYCQLTARNMACQNSRAKVPVPGNYFSSILGISIQFHLCYFFFTLVSTGWGISLRTVGVASKPVKPHLLSFAGFFIYVKRRFVANLKVIDSLMCKKWIFHFYSPMYIRGHSTTTWTRRGGARSTLNMLVIFYWNFL